ncbi:MAG: hypothetical protein KGJ55_04445 [Gammaproteobacteria bacterium]|nr:hypothetical protein [Gammaproteobacteria bacterium]
MEHANPPPPSVEVWKKEEKGSDVNLALHVLHDAWQNAYQLNRERLAQIRRREERYMLRTNLTGNDPAELWRYYIQLVQVEEALPARAAILSGVK